jgi:hypothetical protein
MVILRATRKVLDLLTERDEQAQASDTALGDWYVNRLVIDRQPLLLMVSSISLLPILERAQKVKELPQRLPDLVERRLHRMGIAGSLIAAELTAMSPVVVSKTVDASVRGILVDFGRALPYYLRGRGDLSLRYAEDRLAETPLLTSRSYVETFFPDRRTPKLMAAAWGQG